MPRKWYLPTLVLQVTNFTNYRNNCCIRTFSICICLPMLALLHRGTCTKHFRWFVKFIICLAKFVQNDKVDTKFDFEMSTSYIVHVTKLFYELHTIH